MQQAELRKFETVHNYDLYAAGDTDFRPWGNYIVIKAGSRGNEDFCEKIISINPRQMLSLQAHVGRREIWTVQKGVLTVIVSGQVMEVSRNETVIIPLNAPHCMINRTFSEVVVHELQEGVCREEDNIRYMDFSSRPVVQSENPLVIKSKQLYAGFMREMSADRLLAKAS